VFYPDRCGPNSIIDLSITFGSSTNAFTSISIMNVNLSPYDIEIVYFILSSGSLLSLYFHALVFAMNIPEHQKTIWRLLPYFRKTGDMNLG